MKVKTYAVAFVVTALAVITITHYTLKTSPKASQQPPGPVFFPAAGVSLDVGTGWQRHDSKPGSNFCPPLLVSSGGMIYVTLFAADHSGIEIAADELRTNFNNNPLATKDTFKQEKFTAESGLQGLHVSYNAKSQKDGHLTDALIHDYVVKNLEGRCVSVNFIGIIGSESDAIHQKLMNSLRLQ
jgi:hypothetical protein